MNRQVAILIGFLLLVPVLAFSRITGDMFELIWPTQGYVTSVFGYRQNPEGFHGGIDIAGQTDAGVSAAQNGQVIAASKNFCCRRLGKCVKIDHRVGCVTVYAYLDEVVAHVGQIVRRGELIGTVGSSGSRVSGPHLHFELRCDGVHVNPNPFFID